MEYWIFWEYITAINTTGKIEIIRTNASNKQAKAVGASGSNPTLLHKFCFRLDLILILLIVFIII